MEKNELDRGRILFLDYLRAVACLLVVFGHVYLMSYNGLNEIVPWVPGVTHLLFGPDAVARNIFTVPSIYIAINYGINVGALGVSIFFLISGFVILKAVEHEPPLQFIVRRIFRIYPVSLTAALIAGGVTAIYCSTTGTVSPHSWVSVFSSGFILNGYLHHFEVTPVLWSLEVELTFYAMMATLAILGRLGFYAILGLGLLCMAFTLAAHSVTIHSLMPPNIVAVLLHISFDTLEIPYLLVGAMLYRLTKEKSLIRGLIYTALAAGIFLVNRFEYLMAYGDSGGVDLANGAWALALFALALWSGMRWRWIKPLKWFADISYPLYLVHVPLAWLCFAWLAARGWGMVGAGIITGFVIIFVAWLVHVTVEIHAQKAGAYIGRMLTWRRPQVAKPLPV